MALRWSVRNGVLGLAVLLIAVGGGSVIARKIGGTACGAERVDAPASPLQDAALMRQRPDEDRDRIAAAVNAMGPPFGEVVAGRDYYYDQFLRLYGVPGGVLAWTKNSAPVTYLSDEDLRPRWALEPTSKRTAWDVSAEEFLLLNLTDKAPVTVASFDLQDAASRWCVEVDLAHREGDPVSTAFLADGDPVVALPEDSEVVLLRLRSEDGDQEWATKIATAGQADFLGQVTDSVLVVGGLEESRLTDPAAAPSAPSAPSGIVGLDTETGSASWTWDDGPGSLSHVIGTAGGQVLLLVRNARGLDLVAVSEAGAELRRTRLPVGAREATLRGETVLVRSDAGLDGYDAATGKRVWHRAIPTDRPYIPLGFSLGQMPSVDAEHLLLPTVSSLELLDITDGTSTSYRMPAEGLSSDYFAYQLLATERHLGVITNTGAVLAARR